MILLSLISILTQYCISPNIFLDISLSNSSSFHLYFGLLAFFFSFSDFLFQESDLSFLMFHFCYKRVERAFFFIPKNVGKVRAMSQSDLSLFEKKAGFQIALIKEKSNSFFSGANNHIVFNDLNSAASVTFTHSTRILENGSWIPTTFAFFRNLLDQEERYQYSIFRKVKLNYVNLPDSMRDSMNVHRAFTMGYLNRLLIENPKIYNKLQYDCYRILNDVNNSNDFNIIYAQSLIVKTLNQYYNHEFDNITTWFFSCSYDQTVRFHKEFLFYLENKYKKENVALMTTNSSQLVLYKKHLTFFEYFKDYFFKF